MRNHNPPDGHEPALSLSHRAWRLLPRAARRTTARVVTAALAPRPDPVPPACMPGVAVTGELSRASGLGEGGRLMLRAAASAGVRTWPIHAGDRALPPPAVPLVVHANGPHMAAALLGLPRALVRGRRVIGYWAWELPVVPNHWRVGLRFVHEVWVPSRFTLDALRPLLGDRLRLVPHPVAAVPITPAPLTRAAFGFDPAAVVVLAAFSLASSFERKNPVGTVAAFRAAFADRPDRCLVLKLAHAAHFPRDLAALRALVEGCRNIRIDTRVLPLPDMHAMIACADIVLSLHRAEGFGLLPAEAMLLGRPVIATGWSGNMDYMDGSSAALVGYRLIPARDPRGVFEAPGACWAEPDHDDAVAQLQRLADDPQARVALGQAGRQQVQATLGTGPLLHALAGLLG